jgi:hypothetical protein
VLRSRPMYLQISSKAPIWAVGLGDLLEKTTTTNPSTLLHDINSQGDLLKNLDGLIRFPTEPMDQEPAEHGGDDIESSSEAEENVDDAEIERNEQQAVRSLATLHLEDDHSATISLPPARHLLAQVYGMQTQAHDALPSASVLIGVIDGQLTSETPGFNFHEPTSHRTCTSSSRNSIFRNNGNFR